MSALPRYLLFASLCLLLVTPRVAAAQDIPDPAPDSPAPEAEDADTGPDQAVLGRGGGRGRGGMRSYEQVVTRQAVTDDGVFTIHRIGSQLLYEIPVNQLGQEFLWVTRMSRTTAGVGFGGEEVDERVVRWVRHDDQIFLENRSYSMVADADDPIARAVEAANNNAILMAFDITAMSPGDEAVVIDVTSLFATEVPEFSARETLGARGFDRRRSYISSAKAFPDNIEVRAVQTFTRPADNAGGRPGRGGGMAPGTATIEMAFSMVKLPEEPMVPRLFDERVGYYTVAQTDFSSDDQGVDRRRYITRWRLEKKDPTAEISDPLRPIVYWIDPATPSEWVPYIKQGVEAWQPAFEAAGISNAIIARDAPTPDEDPDWSPEDARYSVVRWLPTLIENAAGPSVTDPRSGEILEADIEIHHNILNLVRNWYFVQASPLDPRAQSLPLPEDLMGRLLTFVVTHEVGHTLGLLHNQKASSTYPLANLRDPEWLARMGHTPTIMDYARFNYVAQPEDNVPPDLLIPRLGPYDLWAVKWGYASIPDADTPDAERPTLDAWARDQDETPWYRFSTDNANSANPGELKEAVGDADAVEATTLGLRNLERVMGYLLEATTRQGENWDDLEELYGEVLNQWVTEMNHVTALVGGVDYVQTRGGQETLRFTPIPPEAQEAAVRFLNERAFRTPEFMIRPDILRRIEREGILERVVDSQGKVLDSLLDARRFTRLAEQEALDERAYAPARFLEDLRHGVWSELFEDSVATDTFRRNLQRAYLELIEERIDDNDAVWNDMRALLRGQLRTLAEEVEVAIPRTADTETLYHLRDVGDEISRILDPLRPERSADNGRGNAFVIVSRPGGLNVGR